MENVSNNKKANKILCYFGIFFLTILLIIPPLFRLIFKEEKKEIKKDIVTTMKCNREMEEVDSTFLNNEPQAIQYSIIGNYLPKENETDSNKKYEAGISELLVKFSEYGTMEYDEIKNVSVIKFKASSVRGSADYELILTNQYTQAEYYKSQGFSCVKQTIEQ